MVWWIAASVCAFFVKGLCGFANTLVFTTILSFGSSNASISPVELLLGYPTNIILAWKNRKSIQWKVCLPLALLVIAGSIPGALFLKNADTGIVKLFFGAVIVLVGVEMLLREFQTRKIKRSKKMKQSKTVLGVIGLLSGLLCGLYGVGALLGAYISRVTEDSKSFQANICTVFLAENTFRIGLYAWWGILTLDVARQAAMLVPFMLAGLLLGMGSGRFVNERMAKLLVIALLMASGALLVVQNLP